MKLVRSQRSNVRWRCPKSTRLLKTIPTTRGSTTSLRWAHCNERGADRGEYRQAAGAHRGTSMQQHLPFFGLHTLAKLPHCKLSPPHLSWLLAAPACGAIDSNISAGDSVTIKGIRMIWLPSPLFAGKRRL